MFKCLTYFFFFFCFLGPHPQHMEVPRLRVASELQLPAYITATAMRDLSYVCNLHRGSQQCRVFNPLSKARDRTHILMGTCQVHYRWATMETPFFHFYKKLKYSWFTVLYQFLLYSKVTQSYIDIHSVSCITLILVYPKRLVAALKLCNLWFIFWF